MKQFLRAFFILILLIATQSTVFSQGNMSVNGIVSGKIIDGDSGLPIEYAPFKLFRSKDSTIAGGIYSDDEGKFSLEQVAAGNYYGVIEFAGYAKKIISNISVSAAINVANLGVIKLELDKAIEIQEVSVVIQKDVLKAGIDKKVYNVGEDLTAKGGTANDILNNVPSVQVDQDGNVTLRGDGAVTILIDGKPSSLTGTSGKSLLDAIPAESIERIEVVNNPSAKYDPDGTSGIINIVLKKNKLRGFNGNVSLSAGSGNLQNGNVLNGNFGLSYRNAKFNAYVNYAGRYRTGYRNNYSDIYHTYSVDSVTRLNQMRNGTDYDAGHTFIGGADFYIKTRQVIGFSATGNIGERNRTGDQWNRSYSNDSLASLWERKSSDPTNNTNVDLNVNYSNEFKNDRGNFSASVTQSLGKNHIEGYYDQYYYSTNGSLQAIQPTRQQLLNNEKNNVTTAMADLVYLYPKINGRIEAGVKAIVRNQGINTHSETFDTLSGNYYADTLANFDYTYNEQIYSAYFIWGQKIKKFSYQAGLRAEQAAQIPDLVSDSLRIENRYSNLFPSAHIRYELNEKSEISLSYSKRVNRAKSDDLNPFTNYSDPFNLRKGNPYLQPEYIDSYDLGYTMTKGNLTLTAAVFYRHTTGVITRIKEYYSSNVTVATMTNLDKSNSTGAEFILVFKPYKWWKNMLSANGNYIKYASSNTTANWNKSGFMWDMKYNATFEFWKRTATFQINAGYNSPRVSVQGKVQRKAPVDLSFEKSFNSGKWTLGARVTDVFNQLGFYMDLTQNDIYQTSEFKWLTRRYYITFSYKFGKLEAIGKKQTTRGGESGGDGDM